jgi:hypothetical protein
MILKADDIRTGGLNSGKVAFHSANDAGRALSETKFSSLSQRSDELVHTCRRMRWQIDRFHGSRDTR